MIKNTVGFCQRYSRGIKIPLQNIVLQYPTVFLFIYIFRK